MTSAIPWNQPLPVVEDGGLALMQANRPSARRHHTFDATTLQAIREHLRDALPKDLLDPFVGSEARKTRVSALLRSIIVEARQYGTDLASLPDDDEALDDLFAAAVGWGPAQPYLDDQKINEVKIVNRTILVQEAGKPWTEAPEQFASLGEVLARAVNMADMLGVRLDASNPQATVPVSHGTRMHISIPPCTEDGVLVCIRRGRKRAWDLDDVVAHGSLNDEVSEVLRLLVQAQCSFLIAGRTNAGKTGLLEAIANSWPGSPHIVTIEDHTNEIGIRNAQLWTREMVHSPEEFARVAKEALRQTPGVLLPGESRGAEAGAILAMAMSGHAVITTVHANSAQAALRRFASYARQPGAYLYEGRWEDALTDTCEAFQVVIKLDFWEELGLRLIAEIGLSNGVRADGSRLEPDVIPLVRLDVSEDGHITWEVAATVGSDGMLRWTDGHDRTPQFLQEKLRQARARALAHAASAAPTRDVVADTIQRAEHHLRGGSAVRAIATMSDAWRLRRDNRLLALAQQALAQDPVSFADGITRAGQLGDALHRAVADRRWLEAKQIFADIQRDVVFAAAATPSTGWGSVAAEIEAGLAEHQMARQACDAAEIALGAKNYRDAQARVNAINVITLPPALAQRVLRIRVQALSELVARGDGSLPALNTVRAQLQALDASLV